MSGILIITEGRTYYEYKNVVTRERRERGKGKTSGIKKGGGERE